MRTSDIIKRFLCLVVLLVIAFTVISVIFLGLAYKFEQIWVGFVGGCLASGFVAWVFTSYWIHEVED